LKTAEEKSRTGAGSKCQDQNQSCGSEISISNDSDTDTDPDTIRIQGFADQKLEKFLIKNCNLLMSSYRRRLQSSKMNIQPSKNEI
jgi:hypothetical protein